MPTQPMTRLTKLMARALRWAVEEDTRIEGTQQTVQALRRRGLIDSDGKPTALGQVAVWEELPLRKQCDALGLPLIAMAVRDASVLEFSACMAFREAGYVGSWCEGGAMLVLFKALCLDVLAELNARGSRADACTRFLEAQLTIHTDSALRILDSIGSTSRPQMLEAFDEIYSSSVVADRYPGLSGELVGAIYDSLGSTCLRAAAEVLMSDPYQYRKGWPDLTLVGQDGGLRFAEVKTTDRLLRNQFTTIPAVREVLPARFVVLHVSAGPIQTVPSW